MAASEVLTSSYVQQAAGWRGVDGEGVVARESECERENGENEEDIEEEEEEEEEEHTHRQASSRPRPKCYHCAYEGCGKSFTRPCRLEEHVRSHTGERPFACTFAGCSKTFLRDSHLKAHESSHRSEKRYACTACGHGFNTNQHLKRHMLTHEKRTPYQCTWEDGCEAAFHKQTQLRRHVAEVHTHTKPFLCSVEGCGRSFGQNSRLKAHEMRDHGEKGWYLCGRVMAGGTDTECSERFHTWSALQKHIKAEHKAVCKDCGLEFAKPGALRQHMRVHTETLEERRKFTCEECERGFTRRQALLVHTKTVHEGEKPFVCGVEGCGRAFGHKRLWAAHVRSHEKSEERERERPRKRKREEGVIDRLAGTGYEDRRIACEQCEYRFWRAYDYERHVEAEHGHKHEEHAIEERCGGVDAVAVAVAVEQFGQVVVDPSLL